MDLVSLLTAYMAPLMFASLVIVLLIGYPVAFSLAAIGLLYGVVGIELGMFQPSFLQALPGRIYGIVRNDTLLAIPFFTFMGLILERSGMAEDLLETIGQLFGSIRGGLAYAVIFVGALLAATTGVVAAAIISMGLISLPIMLRHGYDRRVATGIVVASGTLAQIIPPSLVLIVMADQLGKSVGDMYTGAFLPGIVLTLLYALYIFILTWVTPKSVPGIPLEEQTLRDPVPAAPTRTVQAIAFLSSAFIAWGIAEHWGLAAWSASTFSFLGLPALAWSVAWIALTTALFIRPILGIIKTITPSLFVTIIVSWAAGYFFMSRTTVSATVDFIVLTITVSVAVALLIAILNQVLHLNLLSKLATQVIFVMVPPLGLVFLVLGTIFIGVATPTEGGAMGASGAIILALMKRRLSFKLTRQAIESTAKLSAFVLFILVGARVFSLTFYGVDGHRWVQELLLALPGGEVGFLIFTNVFIFILAFFLDFFELAFIVIPLLAPAAQALGIDLIWFGVILGVNMQTSFMHPPFGFALFYLRSVAPKEPYIDKVTHQRMAPVTTGQIYWGALPFVVIQIIMIALVISFPNLVMHYKKDVQSVIDPAEISTQLGTLSEDEPPPLTFDLNGTQ